MGKRLDDLELAELIALAKDARLLAKHKAEDPLGWYHPHAKQVAFHSSPKRNRWFLAGNAAGKTIAGAAECVFFALGRHPYREVPTPCEVWAASENLGVLMDGAIRAVFALSPPKEIRRWWKKDLRLEYKNGSLISFKSYDAGRESFQAAEKQGIWYDEEPPEGIYDEGGARVMRVGGDIWGTMTPLRGLSWAYTRIYLRPTDPELAVFEATIYDNPYLVPEEVERFEKQMTNEYQRKARLFGKFTPLSGLTYFSPDVIEARAALVQEPESYRLLTIGRQHVLEKVA